MAYRQVLIPARQLDAPRRKWYGNRFQPTRPSRRPFNSRMDQSEHHPDVWKQLFDITSCGLVLLNPHTVIQILNTAAAKLLGIDAHAAVGRTLGELLPSWKETEFHASLPSFFDAQSTFESVDFDVPGPEKTTLRLRAVSVPAGGSAEPGTSGVLLTITESTDVATLERRLHRAEYQASIGKLARGIAHELNSPLDGVLRYTHLALEHLTEDSPVREYLVHVKEGLDRMVRAVKAFLEFSRQVTTPVNRLADLNKLIDDALLLVQHRAKFQQVRVIKQLDAQLPAILDGGLQHAVVNLLKNAFDAMPRGGTLTITTRHSDAEVQVEIEDTGGGIPEEIRPRIFEPFFSTKPIHMGNGLGLIIAKEVVERSGGTIEFASREKVGTTFRIRVPAAPVESQPHGA